MSRKTVRVGVPSNKPDDLIQLAQSILAKHTADAADSPLDAAKMTKLGTATTLANTKNNAAKDFDAQAQTARQVRDESLGVADGQTAQTKDTVLNLITYARDQLLVINAGNEEALGSYGFDVVVGSAKSPTKKPKTP